MFNLFNSWKSTTKTDEPVVAEVKEEFQSDEVLELRNTVAQLREQIFNMQSLINDSEASVSKKLEDLVKERTLQQQARIIELEAELKRADKKAEHQSKIIEDMAQRLKKK